MLEWFDLINIVNGDNSQLFSLENKLLIKVTREYQSVDHLEQEGCRICQTRHHPAWGEQSRSPWKDFQKLQSRKFIRLIVHA